MLKRNSKGITLIILVITIIILLILAGVTIALLTGENGILNKSIIASKETDKQTATEIMNLKITNVQIDSYAKNEQMPSLQVLADALCQDGDIEYVKRKEKKIASLEPIKILSGDDTILTKLKEYPYQFEIDGKLRLASIDGVKVSSNDTSYNELKERIDKLESTVVSQAQEIKTLKDETIVNKRINLMNTPVDVPITTTEIDRNINITLSNSIEDYKYIEIQIDVHWTNVVGNHQENTILIARDQLEYNNSDTVNWGNNSTFNLNTFRIVSESESAAAVCWFKDNKTLHIAHSKTTRADWNKLRIRNVYGIK